MGFFVPLAVSRARRSTPNMYQSPSGYIFRLKIPNDLKGIVGRCEFRYSLQTGSLRIAKQRAQSISSYLHQLFGKLRSRELELSQDQIVALVHGWSLLILVYALTYRRDVESVGR